MTKTGKTRKRPVSLAGALFAAMLLFAPAFAASACMEQPKENGAWAPEISRDETAPKPSLRSDSPESAEDDLPCRFPESAGSSAFRPLKDTRGVAETLAWLEDRHADADPVCRKFRTRFHAEGSGGGERGGKRMFVPNALRWGLDDAGRGRLMRCVLAAVLEGVKALAGPGSPGSLRFSEGMVRTRETARRQFHTLSVDSGPGSAQNGSLRVRLATNPLLPDASLGVAIEAGAPDAGLYMDAGFRGGGSSAREYRKGLENLSARVANAAEGFFYLPAFTDGISVCARDEARTALSSSVPLFRDRPDLFACDADCAEALERLRPWLAERFCLAAVRGENGGRARPAGTNALSETIPDDRVADLAAARPGLTCLAVLQSVPDRELPRPPVRPDQRPGLEPLLSLLRAALSPEDYGRTILDLLHGTARPDFFRSALLTVDGRVLRRFVEPGLDGKIGADVLEWLPFWARNDMPYSAGRLVDLWPAVRRDAKKRAAVLDALAAVAGEDRLDFLLARVRDRTATKAVVKRMFLSAEGERRLSDFAVESLDTANEDTAEAVLKHRFPGMESPLSSKWRPAVTRLYRKTRRFSTLHRLHELLSRDEREDWIWPVLPDALIDYIHNAYDPEEDARKRRRAAASLSQAGDTELLAALAHAHAVSPEAAKRLAAPLSDLAKTNAGARKFLLRISRMEEDRAVSVARLALEKE